MNHQEAIRAVIVCRLCAGHTMKEMQNWLKETIRRCGWRRSGLPAPLTATLLTIFLCGVYELRVKAKSSNKAKDLIQKIKEVMGAFASDTVAMACTSFRSRIEVVFTADGSFTEYVDSQYVSLLIFFISIKSDDFQLCCAI